jgi:hypothetical protein
MSEQNDGVTVHPTFADWRRTRRFFQAPISLLADKRFSGQSVPLQVFLMLLAHADADGICFPKQTTIARALGYVRVVVDKDTGIAKEFVDTSPISRALDWLCQQCLIERVKRGKLGWKYRLTAHRLEISSGAGGLSSTTNQDGADDLCRNANHEAISQNSDLSSNTNFDLSSGANRGLSSSANSIIEEPTKRTDQGTDQLILDVLPSGDVRTQKNSAGAYKAPTDGADMEQLFAEWYLQYPKKMARRDAEKAYRQALKTTPAADLLAGVMRYAAERTGQDPQFTKHPATWLNKGCWLDEPTPVGAAPMPSGLRPTSRRSSAHENFAMGLEMAIASVRAEKQRNS